MKQFLLLVLVKLQSGSCCAVISDFYKCNYIKTEITVQKEILKIYFSWEHLPV